MSVSRRERFWMLLSTIMAIVIFLGSRSLPEVSAKENRDFDITNHLKIFTDVLAIIQQDYVKEVEGRSLIEGAIKGVITNLDPHSAYLDPDFYQDLQVQTKGEFGGLGLEITVKEGLLVVVSPMENSPADKAGIKPGDAIVKIDGKFTKDFSLIDAVKKLRGPRGSPVTLSLHRQKSGLFDVSLTREIIQVKSVRSRNLGNGYGYVRINQFMETSADDLINAINKISEDSPDNSIHGLVLDLRNNPGGLLTQAIRVSDLFLKEGIIVYTDGRVENQKQKFYAHERGTEPDYPLVVLVNGGSASASEIVAGAFKEHGRAIVVGTKTFGKGSVQTISPLDNGGALSLTTSLYYLKNGQSIQLTGVKPDIEVASKDDGEKISAAQATPEELREGDLPGAIDNPYGLEDANPMRKLNQVPAVNEKNLPKPIDFERDSIEQLTSRDAQFAKAFEVLKSFGSYGNS